ncbi:hypothetical protein [Jiella sonneratiae]|uniref:VCBS repeat-containing protein n=1 Tax=Jiella sonneratiae TaxID=2816856 RepID=A0ABS3J7R0_9HYPH|nr:hypothetical protein [Jiella sonneratiae]MBO0905685.1 hypothetical protein [Jiella sonneratiae]
MLFLAILALGCTFAAREASARSKAAQWLVNEEIAGACETGRGSIDPVGVIERDLNGDGRADLIISHGAIRCEKHYRSLACGMQVCTVLFYIRRGDLLVKVHEMLGANVEVRSGRIPSIYLSAHGGGGGTVRWNGRSFE